MSKTPPDKDTLRTALSRLEIAEDGRIRPDNAYGLYILARMARKAGLATSFRSDEDVLVAMIYGCEVGLSPFQALSSVCVINGRAALWGDAPLSLVMSKGLVEDFAEGYNGMEDTKGVPVPEWPHHVEAWCRIKRKGILTPREVSFSVGDASSAGLWGKRGPWLSYPLDMLKYKARARALSLFSDVLRGIRQAEDLDMMEAREPFDPERVGVEPKKTKAERIAEELSAAQETE